MKVKTLLKVDSSRLRSKSDEGEGTSKDGQFKSKKQKMDRQYSKGKKKTKENHSTLIDDDFEEDISVFLPQSSVDAAVEDISLFFSQPSQDAAAKDISLFVPHPSQDVVIEEIFIFDPSSWKGTTSTIT